MSAISKYKGKVFDTLESSLPRRSIFVNKPIEEWSFKNYVKHHPRADPATILANMKKDLDWLALCDLPMDVKRHVGTLIKESTKIFIDDVKKWLQSNSSSSSTSITLSGPVDIFTGNSHNIIHKYKTSSKRVASSSKKSNKKARFKEEKPKDRSINNDNNDDRGADSSSDDDSLFNDQEEERENINETEEHGGSVVGSKTKDFFDIDNDTLTTTTPQQLDVTEIIPSTASSSSTSITRSALFQWAYTLYLKKSVTMSTTVLGIIREQRAVSVSDALTKMAANLLEDWTTSDVDDAYRFTLSLSLSLIVDVANNNTSKKMLKALEPSHVHEVKEHSKSQSNTIKELPAFLSLIFKETIELLELEGEHPALRYLSNAASKQLETEKDNINLQVIDILTYVIRNVKKWGNEKGATEVDWTHRLVSLLDILLRDTDLSVRMGEKCSMATKVVRQANEHAFGDKEKISSIVGRKIDVIMEHDEFELSASEWKSAGAGDSLVDKQHNKNLRVNACVLLQILRLPFDGFNNDISILSMEWTGAEGKLVSMKRYNNYFVGTTIGDMYLPLTLDDISDFHKTLTLLLHWKNEHLKLRKVVRGPLLRQRRFERSRSNYTSSIATSANTNPDIFFTPTQDRSSN